MKKENYLIGAVAKHLGIHEQTIRTYERRHLIKPHRNKQNCRVFTMDDIYVITAIITLTTELGLNLAGVRLVFLLAKELNYEAEELLDFIDDHQSFIKG